MAKLQVVEKSIRTMTTYRRNNFAAPKIHVFDMKSSVPLSNSLGNFPRRGGKMENVQYSKRHPLERYISVAVHLFAFLSLSLMILNETASYSRNPTGTTMEDDRYPVQKIDFPGVAICNINVISHRRANLLAEELLLQYFLVDFHECIVTKGTNVYRWQMENVKEMANLTLETVKSLIKYMGHLYLFESWEDEPGEMMLLHEILTAGMGKNYNVLRIMEYLIPKCQSILKRCYWQGDFRSCQELFVPRWTQDGYCCTFNYIRWTDDFNGAQNDDFKFDIARSEITGTDYGLWVFLDPHLEDYYYNLLPGRGFKVLIYTASDYPDAPSGGMKEILVGPRSEVFLSVHPTSFYSSPDVIQYDKKKRQCLFNTELHDIFEGYYSYSQCMMLCRTRNILKTCNCIPFFYPVPSGVGKVKICNLVDLECLKRSRYKWWSVEPMEDELTDNPYPRHEDEGYDSHLKCDCLPSCENVNYHVFETSSDINHPEVFWGEGCSNFSGNDTVLSVSFGTNTGIFRLRQDVLFYWYDLMSTYGGLCSLFLGISAITPIDIIYRFCLRIINRIKGRKLLKAKKSKLDDPKIYWNEIL